MDGVDLVDVVAEPVEKLVSRKYAKAALRAHVGKPLVEFTRDIGHGCEARAALGDVDGPVLPPPNLDVLKPMLVKSDIALGRRGQSQGRDPRPPAPDSAPARLRAASSPRVRRR